HRRFPGFVKRRGSADVCATKRPVRWIADVVYHKTHVRIVATVIGALAREAFVPPALDRAAFRIHAAPGWHDAWMATGLCGGDASQHLRVEVGDFAFGQCCAWHVISLLLPRWAIARRIEQRRDLIRRQPDPERLP